ncbi:hypothetical protein BH10BAC3_BH10BAC3_31340 [soil metagenome]
MRLLFPVILAFLHIACFAQPSVSVITQHNNVNRTGWNNKEMVLNHVLLTSNKFGCIGTLAVDDEIYAQPLIANNISIGTYTGSVLYIATVNNTLYAFNAADASDAVPLWQVSLNKYGQRAPGIFDLKDNQYGAPCGGNYRDFSGRMGIVGTPVIDTNSLTLFVVTKTIDEQGNFYSYLNAIDLKTGAHKSGSPQLITAQINGTGEGSVNGVLPYNAKYANQRPGLLLYKNTVYVATASHCDWGPYHGWIMGFDAASLVLKYTYNATPNGWAGGIWMAGQGPSVGDDGNIYLVTGNGTTSDDNTDLTGGRSESLVKLSPDLKLLDWFTPANFEYLDQQDLDYGCDGALIIPNSPYTISGSKEGISYVVDYNQMGRFNAANALVKDTLEFNPNRQGYVHIHGSPVYAGLTNGEFVYAWAETFKLRQFSFNRNTGSFSKTFLQGNRNLDNGMPGAMLSISSNNNDTASAIVWASFPTSGNANNMVRPGTLAAYNAADVSAGELWSSELNSRDKVGKFAKFNSPTVANGKLYQPTFSNAVKVYGALCNSSLNGQEYGSGTGLRADYFSASSPEAPFDNASLVKLDENINFNWGDASPATGISKDVFKVRWTGTLQALTTETYTIHLTASDGVRLWINNSPLIDSWSDKNVTIHTATIAFEKNKQYSIKLEFYANTNPAFINLQWSSPAICKQVIPASQLFATTAQCNSNGTGLLAEYFSNNAPAAAFPATPTITEIVPIINFDWGGGSPANISNDNFKARFTGYVQSLDAGNYTFYVTADDGIRLWINNQLLIDQWIDQGATEYSATIALQQCTKNSIRIEYYENGGDAVCKLDWSGPVIAKQAILASQLFSQPDGPVFIKKPIIIYPNPITGHSLTFALKQPAPTGNKLTIYNIGGQLLYSGIINNPLPGNVYILPFIKPAGMYILRLFDSHTVYTEKFIVL